LTAAITYRQSPAPREAGSVKRILWPNVKARIAIMTTIAAPKPHLYAPSAGAYDRLFYSGMSIVLALTVLVGFAPTYYLRFIGEAPMLTLSGRPMSGVLHWHGALFTGWVVLFVVQTALVAAHRVKLHRQLGIAGVVLAVAMVWVGVSTAVAGAAAGSAPPGIDPLAFLAIPFFDMVMFGGFVTAAMVLRRKKEAHKRLMLLAYISIIVAAVARVPGVLPLGPPAFFGLSFVFVGFGVAYDLFSRRHVHPAYIWGGALLVLSVPLRLFLSGTEAWRRFAELLVA
jgi:hypothetical protein